MFGLKPPQSIFVHANGFLKSVNFLNRQPGDPQFDPFTFAVMVMNSAFASELYLKCLIQIETGQMIKNEHDLNALFRKLPAAVQQEIEGPFDAQMAKMPVYDTTQADAATLHVIATRPKTLRESLKVGGKAFIEWRYLYESETTGHFNLLPLPFILRDAILRRNPKWANFGINLRRIGGALSTSPDQRTPAQPAPEGHRGGDNQ